MRGPTQLGCSKRKRRKVKAIKPKTKKNRDISGADRGVGGGGGGQGARAPHRHLKKLAENRPKVTAPPPTSVCAP